MWRVSAGWRRKLSATSWCVISKDVLSAALRLDWKACTTAPRQIGILANVALSATLQNVLWHEFICGHTSLRLWLRWLRSPCWLVPVKQWDRPAVRISLRAWMCARKFVLCHPVKAIGRPLLHAVLSKFLQTKFINQTDRRPCEGWS
jgi:hypothetical protein